MFTTVIRAMRKRTLVTQEANGGGLALLSR